MYAVLLIQAFFTLFLAGGVFFYGNSIKNRSLGLYALLFGLEVCYFLYGTSQVIAVYPHLYGYMYFTTGALYGPLLWLHFKSVIQSDFKLKIKHLLHLLPAIAINLVLFEYVLLDSNEKLALSRTQEFFNTRIMPANYLRAIIQLVYAIVLARMIIKRRRKLASNAVFYLAGIAGIYTIANLIISWLTLFASGWSDFYVFYIFSNLLTLGIAAMLYFDPKFFKQIKEKYASSSQSIADLKQLERKILGLFNTEQPFLNSNFTISDLAVKLESKPAYVSQTFSKVIQERFNDFVNRYRVNYAKELLQSPEFSNFKIEAIAKEAGFNNKVTFYKAFTKFEQTTPSAFRKSQVLS